MSNLADDERVREIRERLENHGIHRLFDADIAYLLDRLAEAERRGMERAAEIAADKCYELALPVRTATAISMAIRAEAAKLEESR